MSTAERTASSYLEEGYSLRSWLGTRDHKRIAILYALGITFFFFLGGVAAALMLTAAAVARIHAHRVDARLVGAAAEPLRARRVVPERLVDLPRAAPVVVAEEAEQRADRR